MCPNCAAHEAREVRLREALAKIEDSAPELTPEEYGCAEYGDLERDIMEFGRIARRALATPTDRTALDALLAAERERCAAAIGNSTTQAALVADLREAAGRAAHDTYRAAPHNKQHAPEDCPCRDGHDTDDCDLTCGRCNATCYGRPHDNTSRRCPACRPALRAWESLSEATREEFRASQEPALSVLTPLLAHAEARLADAVLRLRRLRGIADDLRDAISRPPLLAPFLGSCVAQIHEETDRGLLAAVSDVVFELRPCGRPLPCPRHGGHPKPPCTACKGYKVVASQTLYGFFNPCKACDGMGVPPGTPAQFCQEMVVA